MSIDASQIPVVYRDLLQAFPAIDPARSPGSGLAVQTLYAHLDKHHTDPSGYSLQYLYEACGNLAQSGIVEVKNKIFIHPTARGEDLITQLTGQVARPPSPPAFPTELLDANPRL